MNLQLLFAFPGGWELIVMLLFFIVPAILWVWALVDILRSNFTNDSNKLIWVLIVILLPILGAILYLAIGRGQKVKA